MTSTREPTHVLDGADAGGQFLRTALGLAVLRNESIRIENVRGDRPKPGLRHQHLAVLETMAAVCDAEIDGAELGAETVRFDPTPSSTGPDGSPRLEGGQYEVDINTAGSVTLLFDALLPLAPILESPLRVTATGGTDVEWSPPLDYFREIKLPLLRRFGLVAACEVDRRGFYPNGGGQATLHLGPAQLESLDLERRGPLEIVQLYSTESESLADRDVAHRQLEGALARLELGEDAPALERHETTAPSPSPGSALVIRLDYGTGVAGFAALGERGVPAERIGETAADEANRFLEREAAVDQHLGDQLLVFLALAGGRVRIPAVTDHVRASRELLETFDVALEFEDRGEELVVTAAPSLDL
ncbi:RNA 3'-terminal phosphate cyclase [Natronolimnobius sp. AArcel1]|uniref:RNA 3'-terminal phosphate cyclase n=1 Tax=Natronolimnobius sp. AArcel1 TaxID=1679093 RepID=UPI0013EC9E22|nr:RNA 3'-terminal phosphate cyclase [Natronolimnobius sp. AArcel1]NGM68093.1 RNA 3'-terminal phosphate cyclase [Natronolimnobius sp. AArcel1]